MAKYTPTGWKMSRAGQARFAAMVDRIEPIVKKRVKKYTLPHIDVDDLLQEARLAAAYAVDTFTESRGNIDGYISTVVTNALAMVVAEALAQCRQPYKQVIEPDGTWRKVPIHHVELEHETAPDESLDLVVAERERNLETSQRATAAKAVIAQLGLGSDAKTLLDIRLHTPPELWILARNLNHGRLRLDCNSICRYVGWVFETEGIVLPHRQRYQRASRELRDQLRYRLGIDEQTYTPLFNKPIPQELIRAPIKQRLELAA